MELFLGRPLTVTTDLSSKTWENICLKQWFSKWAVPPPDPSGLIYD
jgi:hypothetical protein